MIFHENCLLADDSHEISYLIFLKIRKDVIKFVMIKSRDGQNYKTTCTLIGACTSLHTISQQKMGLVMRKPDFVSHAQQSCRPAFTFAHSDKHLICSICGMYSNKICYMQNFNILTSLGVCNKKIIFLLLNQNKCCGYSKEPSQ